MARERTTVSETTVAMPKIHDGVTQTDIETYGMGCYNAGWKARGREDAAERRARADSLAEQIRQALDLADALRDGGMPEENISAAVVRIMAGPS